MQGFGKCIWMLVTLMLLIGHSYADPFTEEQAIEFAEKEDYGKAIIAVDSLLKRDPGNATAHLVNAYVAIKSRDVALFKQEIQLARRFDTQGVAELPLYSRAVKEYEAVASGDVYAYIGMGVIMAVFGILMTTLHIGMAAPLD